MSKVNTGRISIAASFLWSVAAKGLQECDPVSDPLIVLFSGIPDAS